MYFRKSAALFAVLAASLTTPFAANAQDSGFYAGGAFGQTKAKDTCEGVPIPCDDKDTSWKIFGGYQINKNFGAELGYVDLGKATAAGTISGVTVNASIKAKAWELVGVGTIPFADNFSAYGKLGFFRWDVDASVSATVPGFSVAGSIGDRGTDFTYGLGLKYDFTKNLAARLEWQRYNNIGNHATTGKSDVDLFSLGVVFKF